MHLYTFMKFLFHAQVQERLSGSVVPAGHPMYTRVKEVVARLIRANKDIEGLQRQWHITVINDPQVQAFVMPVSLYDFQIIDEDPVILTAF